MRLHFGYYYANYIIVVVVGGGWCLGAPHHEAVLRPSVEKVPVDIDGIRFRKMVADQTGYGVELAGFDLEAVVAKGHGTKQKLSVQEN